MPSPNPDLTPNLKLPSPKPADPPDVPGDIKALATAIDDLFFVSTPHRQTFASTPITGIHSGWELVTGHRIQYTPTRSTVLLGMVSGGIRSDQTDVALRMVISNGVDADQEGEVRFNPYSQELTVPFTCIALTTTHPGQQISARLDVRAYTGSGPVQVYNASMLLVETF